MKFAVNDRVTVDGKEYIVHGFMEFKATANQEKWTEYKLLEVTSGKVKWLSVDDVNREYALYQQHSFDSQFSESNIRASGYHWCDSGVAVVCNLGGNMDVSLGEQVTFNEYEDPSKEQIIALETWRDEVEYSKGYYLNASEIRRGSAGNVSVKVRPQLSGEERLKRLKVVGIVLFFVFIFGMLLYENGVLDEIGFAMFKQHAIRDYLAKSSDFAYQTSITADLDHKQKADVYRTQLTVEAAAKKIINTIGGLSEDMQQNQADGAVGLLTKHEYCMIYQDNQNQTLAQVSTRRYAYSSHHSPYHSNRFTADYYRRYYYSRAFEKDRSKYRGSPSGYGGYRGGYVEVNHNDSYRTYSSSVRQASIDARSSSDEDSSFGK